MLVYSLERTKIKMSEQAPIQEQHKLNERMAKTALMLGVVASLAGNLAESPDRAEAVPHRLRDVHELPGYNKRVSSETRAKLADSTVVLMSRYKGSNDDWEEVCTVTAVKVPGQNPDDRLFLTAGHCIEVGAQSGSFKLPSNPLKSANFMKAQPKEFVITDADANKTMRHMTPLGEVTGISVNTSGIDSALLRVVSTGDLPQTGKRLSDIPSISYKRAKLAQGRQVAITTSPENSVAPINTTGRYLGTVNVRDTDNGPMRKIDLVGIKPKTQDKDACLPGASGSSALAENGAVLGPLSFAVNFGYKKTPAVPSDTLASPDAMLARNLWSKDLRVNMKDFSTICGYSHTPATFAMDMLQGLNNPAEKYVQGS